MSIIDCDNTPRTDILTKAELYLKFIKQQGNKFGSQKYLMEKKT